MTENHEITPDHPTAPWDIDHIDCPDCDAHPTITPTDIIAHYAATIAEAIQHITSFTYQGHSFISDDSTDDLDGCFTMMNMTRDALCNDYRDEACTVLLASFRRDDPKYAYDNMPGFPHATWLDSYHDLACDTPTPPQLPEETD